MKFNNLYNEFTSQLNIKKTEFQRIVEEQEFTVNIHEIRKAKRIYILATDPNKKGQKVVGYAKIATNVEKNYDWLIAYYIRPGYRKKGIAKKIMDHVKSATNKNIALRVDPYKDQINEDPEKLRQLYLHFGFRNLPGMKQNFMYFIKDKSKIPEPATFNNQGFWGSQNRNRSWGSLK